MELSVLDLFSGIGGFSVGLEATGKFKTIAFCEQDKFCQKILQKHWQDIPIHEDIKKLNGTKIKADVIVGGFPCQSFSIAGKQKGKEDERYLWDEMFRVIKEVKPKWIIGENVQNLINISNGQILQGIHNDLESQSYEVQTFNISASSQGAWHKRSRIWIVAANTKCLGFSKGCKESEKFKRKETPNKFTNCNQRSQFRATSNELEAIKNVWNTKSTRLKSSINRQGKIQSRGTSSPGTQCKKTWWQTQSELCGIPNGVQYELDKDRVERIKALGNAIVPQIATEIGKAIIKAEEMNEWN
jgi:DNA (cytosine-5)-methyltransferase 1